MNRQVLLEQFFNALISGDRPAAHQIVGDLTQADCSPQKILENLFWPSLQQIQNLYRNDQLSVISHRYATRLLRQLVAQMQLHLEQAPRRELTALVVCGEEESEEIAAQMTADLLEADGYEVLLAVPFFDVPNSPRRETGV